MSVLRVRASDARDIRLLESALRSVTRDVDTVWVDRPDVLAVLPETDGSGASALLGRLRSRLVGRVAAEPSLRTTTFPTNGFTTRALLADLDGAPHPPGAPLGASAAPTFRVVEGGAALVEEQTG